MEEVIEILKEFGAIDVSYPSLLSQRIMFQLINHNTNLIINLSDSVNWYVSDGRPTVDKIYWKGLPSAEIIHAVRKFEGNLNRSLQN